MSEVSGHFRKLFSGDGVEEILTVALYSNAGNAPNNLLFSKKLSITKLLGWSTLRNLDWNINSGTYWIAFEADKYGFRGFMPSSPPDSLNPLALASSTSDYEQVAGAGFGVRIQATPISPIPLPPSIFLFISGLALLTSRKLLGKT